MSMANDDHEFIEWCSVVRSEGANCNCYSTAPQCVVMLEKSTQQPDCIGRGHYSYNQVHFGLLKTLHTQLGQ